MPKKKLFACFSEMYYKLEELWENLEIDQKWEILADFL